MLDFFGKLLHCTALSPVQCNNFPKKIDTVFGLQAFAPMTYFLFFEFLKKEQSMEHVQSPPEKRARAHRLTLTKAGFCAHNEVSAHGRGRVWADTLQSDCSLRLE